MFFFNSSAICKLNYLNLFPKCGIMQIMNIENLTNIEIPVYLKFTNIQIPVYLKFTNYQIPVQKMYT